MQIVLLLAFVCLVLAAGALLCFGYSLGTGDHEQAERLSLLPLEEDTPTRPDEEKPE